MKDEIMEVLYNLFCLIDCVRVNYLAFILLFIHGIIASILGVLYLNAFTFYFPEPLLFYIHLVICFVVSVYNAPKPIPEW